VRLPFPFLRKQILQGFNNPENKTGVNRCRVKYIIVFISIIIVVVVTFQLSQLFWRVHQGRAIADGSRKFEVNRADAPVKILVVGDSTGVGTGAQNPLDSIAGRIYRDNPNVYIRNRSHNGATAQDILLKLENEPEKNFTLVLVQVGGNDILRFTKLNTLRHVIIRVLETAATKGKHVIFMSTGNVGLAPAFPLPLSWIYTWQTRKVRAIFMEAASKTGVEYVDLFKERKDDPFLREPSLFYAADYLHPGSEGYGLWYEELKRQTSLMSLLTGAEGN
jgi:lysophospholipase L1-like esterase